MVTGMGFVLAMRLHGRARQTGFLTIMIGTADPHADRRQALCRERDKQQDDQEEAREFLQHADSI